MLNMILVIMTAQSIHAANVEAGWWSDVKTGESILATRNRAELLMLTVSELSEAAEGFAGNLSDDKLPQFYMYDVELADTAIRLFDQIGAALSLDPSLLVIDFGWDDAVNMYQFFRRGGSFEEQLMSIVNTLSRAMEHNRKSRTHDYVLCLFDALAQVAALAELRHVDLLTIIDAKRAFNAVRADHKIENRLADGGKLY